MAKCWLVPKPKRRRHSPFPLKVCHAVQHFKSGVCTCLPGNLRLTVVASWQCSVSVIRNSRKMRTVQVEGRKTAIGSESSGSASDVGTALKMVGGQVSDKICKSGHCIKRQSYAGRKARVVSIEAQCDGMIIINRSPIVVTLNICVNRNRVLCLSANGMVTVVMIV